MCLSAKFVSNSFNGTQSDLSSVQDLFEKCAARFPDAIAATFNDTSLSYRELNGRANQIACYLRSAGSGPETLVAVCLERSLDMLSALLGIMKAGAAYLPIDIALPTERIRFMLGDAGVKLILTQRSLAVKIPLSKTRQIEIESVLAGGRREQGNPAPLGGPDDLAYVIYTSGSTGRPKGVEILRRNLTHFLSFIQRDINFTADDVMLAHSSLSFDISMFELFLPLITGARVVLAGAPVAAQGDYLRDILERSRISVMLAPPTTWQLLLNSGWNGDPQLKAISGGEVLTPALAGSLLRRTSKLWNHYGPTETTISATTYRLDGNESRVPIGRGIDGFKLLILDQNFEPVRAGATGELFIGGPGLARGYRNRPELTALRFIKVCAIGGPDERVYRTGDLVRQLADGNIDYIGRVDNQVKIRGFRVELEEIETVLARFPGIGENAVVAREFQPDGRRLIAFYTAKGSTDLEDSELRLFLRRQLPAHMVPSAFVRLPQLPTMISGKIDRQALLEQDPVAEWDPVTSENDDVVEAELLAIWRRTMAPQSVQPTDNFFEIGGHSLLAARLVEEIENRFGTRLPLSVLFQAPTVREIAGLVRDAGWTPSWSPLVPIRVTGRLTPLFCVHPIGGNVISFHSLGKYLGNDQPLYGLQARGLDGTELPHMSVEAMASDYIDLIQKVQSRGPYLLAGYSAGGIVAFEMARQLEQRGETVALLALFDAYMGQPGPRAGAAPVNGNPKAKGGFSTLVARLRHFKAMASEEKLASLQRNTVYLRSILTMELRIHKYLMLQKIGIPAARLRNVDDAFGFAVRTYKPEALNVNAVLFRAAKSDGDHDPDPTMGWKRYIAGPLAIRKVEGDHFTILYEPYVKMLGESLAAIIPATLQELGFADSSEVSNSRGA